MVSLSPYINFNGNCEEAFNFYKSVFGGEFQFIGRFKDMPPMEGMPPMSEEAGNKVMHVSLPIGSDTFLFGSDAGGEWANNIKEGNNIQISVNADSKEEADRLYNGLAEGGQKTMPIADTFWGAYFGMLIDKYGINWMVNHDAKPEGGQN